MSETWYRAKLTSSTIEEVKVTSSTLHFVQVEGGRREAKITDYDRTFSTWKEAHDCLRKSLAVRVEALQRSLSMALDQQVKVGRMKDPSERKEPV